MKNYQKLYLVPQEQHGDLPMTHVAAPNQCSLGAAYLNHLRNAHVVVAAKVRSAVGWPTFPWQEVPKQLLDPSCLDSRCVHMQPENFQTRS